MSGHLNGGKVRVTFDQVDDVECDDRETTIHFSNGRMLIIPNDLIKERREIPKKMSIGQRILSVIPDSPEIHLGRPDDGGSTRMA